MSSRIFATVFILAGSAFVTACQSGNPVARLTSGQSTAAPAADAIRESELRAYCPPITLRDGTASFRTYEGNAEGDPDRIVYQASVSDTTRVCNYGEGTGTVTAAVAGRVVPGPRGRTGTITIPIRVTATRGDEVIYSQLFQHSVAISDTSGATQFVFTDPNIVIPGGIDRNVQLVVALGRDTDGR